MIIFRLLTVLKLKLIFFHSFWLTKDVKNGIIVEDSNRGSQSMGFFYWRVLWGSSDYDYKIFEKTNTKTKKTDF